MGSCSWVRWVLHGNFIFEIWRKKDKGMHVCVLCYRSFSFIWNVGFCWYLNPSFFSWFVNVLPFHWEVMVPYEPSSWVCVKSPMKKNSSLQVITYINQRQDRPSLLWLNWVQYDLKFGKCKVWHILSTLKVSAVKKNLKEVLRKNKQKNITSYSGNNCH